MSSVPKKPHHRSGKQTYIISPSKVDGKIVCCSSMGGIWTGSHRRVVFHVFLVTKAHFSSRFVRIPDSGLCHQNGQEKLLIVPLFSWYHPDTRPASRHCVYKRQWQGITIGSMGRVYLPTYFYDTNQLKGS